MIVNRKGVTEQVADIIKRKIQDGIYKEGDKILGEREMAETIGVSRNTVREAYKILEAYGYLTVKHGTGVFISSSEHQIQKMTESFFVSTDHVKDFFAVRMILEEFTVKGAIENFDSTQIDYLEKIILEANEIIEKGVNFEQLAELDHKFHLTLANSSKNVVLIRIMNFLIDLLSETRTKAIQIPGRPLQSILEHAQILEAIKQKDIDLAQACMWKHLDSVEQSITDNS